jgi:hypothetical protein
MTDEKRKDEAPESKENPSEETRSKGLSRRDFLISIGLGASGLLVAGATHYMNNLPDSAIQGLIERGVAADITRNISQKMPCTSSPLAQVPHCQTPNVSVPKPLWSQATRCWFLIQVPAVRASSHSPG